MSDWTEYTDPASGKPYYYNAVTQQTVWDRPAEFGGAAPAENVDVTKGTKRSTISKKKAQPQTVAEKLATRSRKYIALRRAEKVKTNPSAFAKKRNAAVTLEATGASATNAAPAAAASSWQQVTHPETGQVYYYNPTTGETAWTIPA